MIRFIVGFLVGAITAGGLVACGDKLGKPNSATRSRTTSTQQPTQQFATITKVVDGDTLHVSINGQDKTIRLIGVDSPEVHKPGVKVECGGKEASANMARLAPVGARARLTYDPTQDRVDRYGRLLAYVGVNHRSLNLEQVYAGLAEVYVYRKNFQRVEAYRRAAGVAQRAHRGVWGACNGDFHDQQPGK